MSPQGTSPLVLYFMDKDAEEVLRKFLEQHWQRYATDTERNQYNRALRRPKAADSNWVGSAFARRVEAEWARADEATRLAVLEGAESIRKKAIEGRLCLHVYFGRKPGHGAHAQETFGIELREQHC